jgi:hypothetical protein
MMSLAAACLCLVGVLALPVLLIRAVVDARRALLARRELDLVATHLDDCDGDCGGTYTCVGCKRLVGWCDGANDDMPEHCTVCWCARQDAQLTQQWESRSRIRRFSYDPCDDRSLDEQIAEQKAKGGGDS